MALGGWRWVAGVEMAGCRLLLLLLLLPLLPLLLLLLAAWLARFVPSSFP